MKYNTAYWQAYRKKNKTKLNAYWKEYQREYRRLHREQVNAVHKKYRDRKKERENDNTKV